MVIPARGCGEKQAADKRLGDNKRVVRIDDPNCAVHVVSSARRQQLFNRHVIDDPPVEGQQDEKECRYAGRH